MARPSKGPHLIRRTGVWYIAWADGSGRSLRRSTGTRDRAAAQADLAAFLVELGQPIAGSVPIAILLDRYLADRWPAGAPNAERFARNPLARHFPAVDDITAESVRRYIAGRGVKATTAARELTVLRAALRHAVAEGILAVAPAVTVPGPAEPRDRWLTRQESARLFAACHEPHLRLFIMLGLHTGARRGAILDLTWFQVDLERSRIDYNAPGRAQTRKRRPVVPINGPLHEALQAARKVAVAANVVEYRGRKVAGIRRSFAVACRRAGLEDVIPHTLRHTAATWMAQAGVSIVEIAQILGQSVQRTTERYIKHHPDYLRAGVDALAGADWRGMARNPGQSEGNSVPCRAAISRKIKAVR